MVKELEEKVINNKHLVSVKVNYKGEFDGWELRVKGKGIDEGIGIYKGQDEVYREADDLEERLGDLGLILIY